MSKEFRAKVEKRMMIKVGDIRIGGNAPLVLIAGPCVVESKKMIMRTAERIVRIAERRRIPLIFKSSYKKANRTSARSFSSIGASKRERLSRASTRDSKVGDSAGEFSG